MHENGGCRHRRRAFVRPRRQKNRSRRRRNLRPPYFGRRPGPNPAFVTAATAALCKNRRNERKQTKSNYNWCFTGSHGKHDIETWQEGKTMAKRIRNLNLILIVILLGLISITSASPS